MKLFGKLTTTGQTAVIETNGSKIQALTAADTAPEGAVGGSDVWISPGWIDLQFNGYGGYDFNRDSWTTGDTSDEAPRKIFELAARGGTAMLCPTIVTNTREGMIKSLQFLRRTVESDRQLSDAFPGYHVEGPYISSEEGLRGAHPKECTRNPDWDEFQEFQEAADGRIKILTLAPEREGALPFIEKATAAGVKISIGHSGATPDEIRDAIAAGAHLSTHLGNGSQNMIQRHRNYFFEQLAADEMTSCIITDGHHLPEGLVKIISRVKPSDKLVIVSDAVALGGKPAGIYDDGRHEVLPSGKVVLAGTPYLAGAGHLLDTCAANYLRWTGGGMSGLTKAIAYNPAAILDLPQTGQLEVGKDADLTLFRETSEGPLEIAATVLKGEAVYQG
jgi:N-acetylglucosamine-6-phosphate deacetylase